MDKVIQKKLALVSRLYELGCPDRAASRIVRLPVRLISQWRREKGLPPLPPSTVRNPDTHRLAGWDWAHPDISSEFSKLAEEAEAEGDGDGEET